MAFHEPLAQRVRDALPLEGITERKMFGGLCFLDRGHMCCCVKNDELMVRVGPDAYEDALAQEHAREMKATGRSMRGFVYVAPEGLAGAEPLQLWVERALAFTQTLAPKPPKKPKPSKTTKR